MHARTVDSEAWASCARMQIDISNFEASGGGRLPDFFGPGRTGWPLDQVLRDSDSDSHS